MWREMSLALLHRATWSERQRASTAKSGAAASEPRGHKPLYDAPMVQGRSKRLPHPEPGGLDADAIVRGFADRMRYALAKDEFTAKTRDVYEALAYVVRDRLVDRWFETQNAYYQADAKRVYYLSLEFLIGRTLLHNILNLEALPAFKEAMSRLGYDLEDIAERSWDAGLGNGGLGRLAACFLDSAATLSLPFYGYGIRYEYGIFRQRIRDGFQVEAPDNWLRYGNPWEIPRPSVIFPVDFYGRVEHSRDANGRLRVRWVDTRQVWAMAYDMPVIGYGNNTVNALRLWAAKSSREFDLKSFNAGEYVRAVEDKNDSENISKVLYPPDDQYAGKTLRLKQQYFFVSATLQDVIRRFLKRERSWTELPHKVAIQLNDTHPALAIPELMRVLMDQQGLEWEDAWALTQQVFAYTNHTILPEALEAWSGGLLKSLLPRPFEIVEEIDRRWRGAVRVAVSSASEEEERLAVIGVDGRVRMAHLAIVGSHSTNGVAKLHSRILRETTFAGFHRVWPERFNNKTNGITPRRWLLLCNPRLASLVTEAIGDGWITDLDQLELLRPLAADAEFRARWAGVKQANKRRLTVCLRRNHAIDVDPEMMYDCQVKRIHEYKRQLLNVLHVVALYHRIREGHDVGARRCVIMAGKAAPSYVAAKLLIKLVHSVATLVASDPAVASRLRMVFLPNYSVSMAEHVFPACELSEQISTAGTEASGTGNMKAALNGALTIGTWDGANVEIAEAVGPDEMFIFGKRAEDLDALRRGGYDPGAVIEAQPELRRVVETIGALEPASRGLFDPILESLTRFDPFFVCVDFADYVACQERAAMTYRDPETWWRRSILNAAGMGRFSIDRTTREYASEIWHAQPVPVPFPPSA
jgi:starch phosphorylase